MELRQIFYYIKSDLYRYTGNINTKIFFHNYFFNRGFKYTFWLRLCKSENRIIYLMARIMHWRLSRKYLIQIPYNTKIGYGLYLGHHMCVVINATSIIGNNVNLSQFTTIGANSNINAAIIGDNVYIGPSCCIVGNIIIESNVTIGAGSVVVKNVEQGITIAGAPAKFISNKTPGRFVNNRWNIL